jgi:hypothetical protein
MILFLDVNIISPALELKRTACLDIRMAVWRTAFYVRICQASSRSRSCEPRHAR